MPILVAHRTTHPDTGEVRWLRWSNGKGFTSTPSCEPANTVWLPRVIEGGNYERHAFGAGRSRGRSTFAAGEVILNALPTRRGAEDGLHYLRHWSLTGQPLEIWRGPRSGASFPADFEPFLIGVVARVRWSRRRLVLELADFQADFADRLLVTGTFAGDNALPDGLEGTPDDVGGRYLSQPYGQVRNATLSLVNTVKLIGQVAARAERPVALDAIEDGGSPYGADTDGDFADLAELVDDGEAPDAGKRRFYPGTASVPAYARLGTEPSFAVTADIAEGATEADRSAAQVATRMLRDLGVNPGSIEGAAALDTRNPDVVGWWAGSDGSRGGEALDAVLGGIGAWWVGSRRGTVALGRLEAPKPFPDRIFEEWEILGFETLPTEDDEPVGHLSLEWGRNWTVQRGGQLAAVALVDQAERTWRAQEFRTVTDGRDESIFARWPRARTVTWRSHLDTEAAARAELARLKPLYAVPRPTQRLTIEIDRGAGLDFGMTIGVRHRETGWPAGIRAVLTGEIVTQSRNRLTLCLWGAEKWI